LKGDFSGDYQTFKLGLKKTTPGEVVFSTNFLIQLKNEDIHITNSTKIKNSQHSNVT